MASNIKLGQRIVAGVGAAIFLITSCALTAMVIWENVRNKDVNQSSTQTTDISTADNLSQNVTDPSKALAGKPLANFTPISKVDSLQTTDTKTGSGEEVKAGDTVLVDYTGAVAATGTVFQSSRDMGEPISFSLANVIPGWSEGMVGMKVGGERRLVIPAAKAYGSTPPEGSGIPVDADLVFDVTLHSIEK